MGQFSGHLKVEVYLMEIELCKDFELDKTVKQKFSRKELTGDSLLFFFNVCLWTACNIWGILFILLPCLRQTSWNC